MTAVDLPITVTVAATATAVQLVGHHPRVHALNLGSAVVYARTDGTAAVAAAAHNVALPVSADESVSLVCVPSGGTLALDTGTPVTDLSMISASGNILVHLSSGCQD